MIFDSGKLIQAIQSRFPGVKFYSLNGELVWEDETIPQPSSEDIEKWISEIVDPPDWERLLKESGPFVIKAQTTTNSNAFSLLITTLTTIRTVPYLEMAINQVRSGMKQAYTVKEIDGLNQLLSDCNIDLVLK